MIVTSEDVAKVAGVSRATVSQILNGHGQRFAEETRQRVKQAAVDLDYQPSVAARALVRGSSDVVIALIPPMPFGAHLQGLLERLTVELAERGLTLVLRLAPAPARSLDPVSAGLKPRAVISLVPISGEEQALLEHWGVPLVDRSAFQLTGVQYEIGAFQARYLIEKGYTRLTFAHLRAARDDPMAQAREAGLRETCRAHGVAEPSIICLDIDPPDALRSHEAVELRGAAIACFNDDVAFAVLYAAAARGWATSASDPVIGMGGTPPSRLTRPALTTLDYDAAAVASAELEEILAALSFRPRGSGPRLGPRLIEGETT